MNAGRSKAGRSFRGIVMFHCNLPPLGSASSVCSLFNLPVHSAFCILHFAFPALLGKGDGSLCVLRLLIVPPKLFIGGAGSRRNHSPQPTVNNFAPPKKLKVNNLTFTRSIKVNTPGPEDECCLQNAQRFTGEFRSGPGALMQRNSQSISPARQEGRDEPSIRISIHQGPRVQLNEPIKL